MKWSCIDSMPIKLEVKMTLKQQIKEILDDIVIFGKTLQSEENKKELRAIYHKLNNLNK